MHETAPTSWFDEVWPRAVAASGVGYVALSYAISRWLTRRSPAAVPMPAEFPPCAIEPIHCRTHDGIDLRGWRIEPPAPRANIALFHGMRLNRSAMMDRAAILAPAGYRCIAFDHRAHGESGGASCTFGYYERHDVAAVLEWIRASWPGIPCGAVGMSMGGAALCFAGGVARGFQAVVLESVYAELARAFDQRIGRGYPAWLRHFRRGIIWFTERRMGAPIEQVSPAAHVAQLAPTPALVLTGSDDPHAPPDEVQLLVQQLPSHARFHVIPGAQHHDVCTQGGSLYRDLLLEFFGRHLSVPLTAAAA